MVKAASARCTSGSELFRRMRTVRYMHLVMLLAQKPGYPCIGP